MYTLYTNMIVYIIVQRLYKKNTKNKNNNSSLKKRLMCIILYIHEQTCLSLFYFVCPVQPLYIVEQEPNCL